MKDEALKLALEFVYDIRLGRYKGNAEEISTAIKQALEQSVQEPVAMRMPKVGDRVVCIDDESLGIVVYLTAGGSPEIKFDDGSHGTYMLREFAELFGYTTLPAQEFVCSTGLCHYKPAAPVQEPVAKDSRDCPYCYHTGSVHCGDVKDKILSNGGDLGYCSNAQIYGRRTQPAPVRVDAEGENIAVRSFLMLYGQPGLTVGQMKKHMDMSGHSCSPVWVYTEPEGAHLTKAGAQLWIRHLFALEATPPAAPVQPVASLKEADVLMIAEAHGIDPSTKGLYGFYIDCISTNPPAQPAPVQPVQEPVAWVDLLKQAEEVVRSKSLWKKYIDGTPLANDIAVWMASFAQEHATPPAAPVQPWVGLTDEQKLDVVTDYFDHVDGDWAVKKASQLLDAYEAKLREKNT
jgi:hypothetical protein